jgi:hypothetical protein
MKMPQTLITMMPTQVMRDIISKNPIRSLASIVSFSLSAKEDEDIVLLP